MENKIIKIHEDNLSIFNEKLADLNKKFAKKGLPLINCSMDKTEMHHVDEWTKEKTPYTLYAATLSSDFNQTNLSGVTVITRCRVLKDEYESHVFSKKDIEKIMDSVKQSA